jgi:hypothetical protein
MIPVFLIREGPWRFRFSVGSPILPPQGPWADAQVQQVTQDYVKVLERVIRQFPTQWLMLRPINFASQNLLTGQRHSQKVDEPEAPPVTIGGFI